MKITGPGSVQPSKTTSKKKAGKDGDGGAFAALMGGEAEQTSASKSAVPVSALTGVLGLQEVSDEEHSKKQVQKHGDMLLDQLDAVRHALLLGQMPRERLERVRMQLQQRKAFVSDPTLTSIIEEIEMRAEVELAKWDKIP